VIYRWSEAGGVEVFRAKSGYRGVDVGRYHQPGSNGLTLDREGRLTIDQHGERRVIRVEKHGEITVLADRYEGKRLNSPNDLVYRSDGGSTSPTRPSACRPSSTTPRRSSPTAASSS
jgi:gluconolactonase